MKRAALVSTEISQLPLATVVAILLYAKTHAIPTVLDVDVPPSDACPALGSAKELERALALATFLKPSKAAARELLGKGGDALEMAKTLARRYRNEAVVITDGARGCAVVSDEVAARVAAFDIRAVDTTGAGDAFLGAMIAGIRRGLPWPTICQLANAAGAVCATQVGAFPRAPEVRSQIARLYGSKLPLAEPQEVENTSIAMHREHEEVDRFMQICLDELASLRRRFNVGTIWSAVEIIRAANRTGGRVHVTGVGKPEHVARYVASLLSSVGTPATFLHATETLHGSLGQIHPNDVVIAISNSGSTREICDAVRAIREHGAKVIAVTGDVNSELARETELVLHLPVEREGGVLGLAPRISVLGQIYVLAALSVALEAVRGLTVEEYSRWHRAGTLGDAARKLSARHRALKAI